MDHSDAVAIAKEQRAENIRHEIVLGLIKRRAYSDDFFSQLDDMIKAARQLAAFVTEG